jgi:hypothetical protein
MIPAFNEHGCLPEGIYDCTMKEATQRFGVFQSSDRRPRLWARLTEFIRQVKGCVGISQQFGRSFWSIPAGYFARFRPPISEHFDPLQLGG